MNYLEQLQWYRNREIDVYKKLNLEDVNRVMNVLEDARLSGKHIFICGNGGSAATASHYAGDFNKGVNMGLIGVDGHSSDEIPNAEKMKGIPLYNFECLSDNIPTMMAVSNDESYAESFRFPLAIKMKPGDIVIGISGSGNSANVINAFEYAKANGGTTIAIVGYSGGKMKQMANYSIHVEIDDMQIAEDLHMVLDHMMMWVLSHVEGLK
ncbi:MAG: SIS domain-containing protein [Erysipelotrichaceae bacterium]|nr:SIS domain-containing protein [Clostridia bacterium]MBQ6217201.1 SIS domain-containing protein [Erysipelotrichaceae bacterium]